MSDFTFTFHFHSLEKEMATHSSVLAWRIPGTGEPGGLPLVAAAAAAYRATQDGQVTVESSEKMSTEEGNGKPLQYSCLENPMNSMKRQKDRTLKDELPRSVDAQYATRDPWRSNSRKNEEVASKQKQHPVVDMTADGSKARCCKEQYCIGTWNVRSMNQGILELVKQEMP